MGSYYSRNPHELERIFGGGAYIGDPWTGMTPGGESRRYQNVPQAQTQQTAITSDTAADMGYGRQLLRMLGQVDDTVQGAARRMYGQGGGIRQAIGETFHIPRQDYLERDQIGALIGSRALQTGGLTAAGMGLANLTHAFQNQFGGSADEPKPGTLNM